MLVSPTQFLQGGNTVVLVVVLSDPGPAAVHLLWSDGGQRPLGQLQAVHYGLEPLEGQGGVVVVHLNDPGDEHTYRKTIQFSCYTHIQQAFKFSNSTEQTMSFSNYTSNY